jgi:hypothetical protein
MLVGHWKRIGSIKNIKGTGGTGNGGKRDIHNWTHKVTPIGRYTDPDFSYFSEELILKSTIPDRRGDIKPREGRTFLA